MRCVLVGGLLLLLVAAAVAKIFVLEIPLVGGDDMAPTLLRGDRLLANRLKTAPRRGDLVLLEHPQGSRLLLRRVVALPGDRVAVKAEVPVINGVLTKREPKGQVTLHPQAEAIRQMLLVEESAGEARYLVLKDPSRRSVDTRPLQLQGAYFVMSDNRNHGSDSRTFGPVPQDKLRAVITHRLSAGAQSVKPLPPRPGFAPLRQQ